MKRATMVLGVAIAVAAAAQSTGGLITVDSVTVAGNSIAIKGVPEGGSAQVTQTGIFSGDAAGIAAREECHRMLLLALGKPGQYRAQVWTNACTVALVAP